MIACGFEMDGERSASEKLGTSAKAETFGRVPYKMQRHAQTATYPRTVQLLARLQSHWFRVEWCHGKIQADLKVHNSPINHE